MSATVQRKPEWWLVILLLFLFFPVGIYLLVKKVTREKQHYAKNAKVMIILGGVLIAMCVIYVIMGLTGDLSVEEGESVFSQVIFAVVLFGGGGGALLVSGKRLKDKGAKFLRYAAIVKSQRNGDIQEISQAYPAPYEDACSILQEMVDAGYFPDAYIDLNRGKLVIPSDDDADLTDDGDEEEKPRRIKCPGCGAMNVIEPGEEEECEYCGLPLHE